MEREGGVIAFALEKMVYGTFEADWADSVFVAPNPLSQQTRFSDTGLPR
jgi:hypothetical protein